jgi:probable rRNA maturation factor
MFTLQNRILVDFRNARDEAERAALQRSTDDKVLGAVGLDEQRPLQHPEED